MLFDPSIKNLTRNVGTRLRSLRTDKGLKIWSVEHDTKISKATISKIENGKYRLNLEMVSKLANYYGSSLEDIISIRE